MICYTIDTRCCQCKQTWSATIVYISGGFFVNKCVTLRALHYPL